MGRALMIGGVFLLSRNPEALADWYRRHLEWELAFLPEEGYYTELYFREDDEPDQRQHLVFAIMPGDPGNGEGHIINYRVDDIESVVATLREEGVETSEITQGPDADGEGRFARLRDPEGHRIELWQHLDAAE
jgi:catechol 2,3-dioxygenase-like lactoylglutathione lyase family enzyme